MGRQFDDLPGWEFTVVETSNGIYEVSARGDGGVDGSASDVDVDAALLGLREWATRVEHDLATTDAVRFRCPVCDAEELTAPPYEVWPPPADVELQPPYEDQLGSPSYEVCPKCGFEFGNDDNPGTAPPVSFDAYRRAWIADGSPRFSA
jgi:predicted RNA-binding Zn-ribbon protein involved in translation (DUF1610 family)